MYVVGVLRINASRGARGVVVLAITKCGGFEKIVKIILKRLKIEQETWGNKFTQNETENVPTIHTKQWIILIIKPLFLKLCSKTLFNIFKILDFWRELNKDVSLWAFCGTCYEAIKLFQTMNLVTSTLYCLSLKWGKKWCIWRSYQHDSWNNSKECHCYHICLLDF